MPSAADMHVHGFLTGAIGIAHRARQHLESWLFVAFRILFLILHFFKLELRCSFGRHWCSLAFWRLSSNIFSSAPGRRFSERAAWSPRSPGESKALPASTAQASSPLWPDSNVSQTIGPVSATDSTSRRDFLVDNCERKETGFGF